MFTVNEYDEVLEKNVRLKEKIDESDYDILKNSFYKVITTQNGSRVLQKAFKNTSSAIIIKIFEEILPNFHEMMIDSYANYFCHKFFRYLNPECRLKFLLEIKDYVIIISNSKVGTYPLQAIIEQLNTNEEKLILIDAVRNNVLEMCQVII